MRFPDPLAARVASTPGATAVIDAAGGGSIDYADLNSAVETLAGRLAGLGVGPGDHVGVLAETSQPAVRTVHAVARLGARFVGLNCRLADRELARQLDAADVDIVLCDPEEAERGADLADVPVAVLPDDGAGPGSDPLPDGVDRLDGIRAREVDPYRWALSDPSTLLFTSGTTGDPKPVVLTYGNLLASAIASAFRLGVLPDDRWLLPLSVYHMGGLAPIVRSTLYGTAVVPMRTRRSFDPGRFAAVAREHRATGVSMVPTMLRRVVANGHELPDSLRFVLLGGAPAPRELIEACVKRGVPVCPTYGMTETASQIATVRPGGAGESPESVGRPLLGTSVSVLDEAGELCPPGEPGEIAVEGPTVMAGYYRNNAATEAAMCEHGLRTGDIGYRDAAGRLYVLNRREDRIVSGGENVDPGGVAAVLREHPEVAAAAVVGLDDPDLGERVGALVVPSEGGGTLTPEGLHEWARGRLAGFELPRTIGIVEELPRTASGTVDRTAARDRLRSDGTRL